MTGWVVKQGSGFPYLWQRRCFVYLPGSVLRYYAQSDVGAPYTLKGEAVVLHATPMEPAPGLSLSVRKRPLPRGGGGGGSAVVGASPPPEAP
eukprot:6218771-Prymnesium_polylepis.1